MAKPTCKEILSWRHAWVWRSFDATLMPEPILYRVKLLNAFPPQIWVLDESVGISFHVHCDTLYRLKSEALHIKAMRFWKARALVDEKLRILEGEIREALDAEREEE